MNEYIGTYINMWKNAFDFKGRTTTKEFVTVIVINVIISVLIQILSVILAFIPILAVIFGIVLMIYCFLAIVPGIAIFVRWLREVGVIKN